jgi:hypothetical protein
MWKKLFKLKGIRPGEVIFPRFGKIDFRREDLDPDLLLKIWEDDHRYLEMTEEGEKHFFGLHENVQPRLIASQQDNPSQQELSLSAKDLVKKIKNAESLDEAEYYYNQGIQYKTVQDAYYDVKTRFIESQQPDTE